VLLGLHCGDKTLVHVLDGATGESGTNGTTGRVLLPDARLCAGGKAHGDPDRLLAAR
jgi:hypothetical protein